MTVLRVRGYALPEGEMIDLYADGDRWTADPIPGAELVGQGWLLPGLVDAHTHPGASAPGNPLNEELLRADLREHLAAGVTMIRSPGLAGDPPSWFGQDPQLPRAVHAGPWIAQHGQFFDGWGHRAEHDDLPRVAAEQAGRTGWATVIADWRDDGEALPVDVVRAVVDAVHAVGGRVAVHSQQADGGAAAVAAKVDSLEHGMCLDSMLLAQMAEQGTVLTPTLTVIAASLEEVRQSPDSPRRRWYVEGADVHPGLAAAAAEAGVTLLAGTDSRPHGRIADEVRGTGSGRSGTAHCTGLSVLGGPVLPGAGRPHTWSTRGCRRVRRGSASRPGPARRAAGCGSAGRTPTPAPVILRAPVTCGRRSRTR